MSLERYGNYSLRRGDYDLAAKPSSGHGRYEGKVHPGPTDPGYVKQLQKDLLTLGFLLVGKPDGDFGGLTELALREFQIYARFESVAKLTMSEATYANTLSRETNPSPYVGVVSGALNKQLATTLVSWLENEIRCPVVVEAREVDRFGKYDINVPPEKKYQNIWQPRQVTDRKLALFTVDFSSRYDGVTPDDYRDENGRIKLGFSKVVKNVNGTLRGGPAWKSLKHSIPSAEILPQSLIGKPWVLLSNAEKSTFNVIRVVADLECKGTFDAINGYDNAVLSIGPYHHTLLLEKGFGRRARIYSGELGAYLAYLQTDQSTSYQKLLEENGIGFGPVIDNERNWEEVKSLGIYTGLIKFQDANGNYSIEPNNFTCAEYFRNWHWIYRFSAASRTDEGFRTGFWFMTQLRLWDILSAEWDGDYIIQGRTGPARKALIGDIFRSEAAVTILLRYHVSAPANIVNKKRAGAILKWALENAGFDYKASEPKDWTDDQERQLILKLVDGIQNGYEVSPGVRLKKIKGWTVSHAKNILDWPASEGSRYSGRRPTSRLLESMDGEKLKKLSWGREDGFKFHKPLWGIPEWE
jgi:hypothetical protein